MLDTKLSLSHLKKEIKELKQSFPVFKNEDLFVIWFLKAYVTDDDTEAADAIVNGPKDKGIDAVLIDDSARSVFIVQGKYRQQLAKKNESITEVLAFANLAEALIAPAFQTFKDAFSDGTPVVYERLKQARRRLVERKYRLFMFYVTLGKCGQSVITQTKKQLQILDPSAIFEMFAGYRNLDLLRDYLDGVAPPIPTIELEMEKEDHVSVNGIMQRYDDGRNIESWVFPMRGNAIGNLFERYNVRLFARNIRGYLGDKTSVNQGMANTLRKEPGKFFYYNNGITMLCDKAEKRSHQGKDVLIVSNPQIINGQQTTRTLAAHINLAKNSSVLVKVIQVPRDTVGGKDSFDSFVEEIVKGTNWQNAIRSSDLVSNDRKQIELERELRKLGYLYLRKSQSKSEARRAVSSKQYLIIKKAELAVAVAGCNMDPIVPRSGRENLFDGELYNEVFPNTDPNYYLPRYWLMREVTYAAKGRPGWGYAKWLVQGFVWAHLRPLVNNKRGAEIFRMMCEQQDEDLVGPLNAAIKRVYMSAQKFYLGSRGQGSSALDVSQFYRNKQGLHLEFEKFWKGSKNPNRPMFKAQWEYVETAIV